jgi:hypothetical protein
MDRIFGAIKESPAASMFAGSIAVVYTARGLLGRKPRPIAPSPIAWKGLHYKSLFLVDGKASSPARKKKSPNRRLKSKVSPSDYYDRMVSPSKVHTPERKMKVHASPSPFSRAMIERIHRFDLYVWVLNSDGKHIHNDSITVANLLDQLRIQVYSWDPADCPTEEDVLYKSSASWEVLASEFSDKCFRFADSVGTMDFHTILVKTMIHGRDDKLLSVDRTVTTRFTRETIHRPEAAVSFKIPAGLQVSCSLHKEILDLRPMIAGSRETYQDFTVTLFCSEATRVKSTQHLDWMSVYAPLRHLVLQGKAIDSRRIYHGQLMYDNLEDLGKAFEATMLSLRSAVSAQTVARQLQPFLCKSYYIAHEEEVVGGAGRFCDHLQALVAQGLESKAVLKVMLEVDGTVVRTLHWGSN